MLKYTMYSDSYYIVQNDEYYTIFNSEFLFSWGGYNQLIEKLNFDLIIILENKILKKHYNINEVKKLIPNIINKKSFYATSPENYKEYLKVYE